MGYQVTVDIEVPDKEDLQKALLGLSGVCSYVVREGIPHDGHLEFYTNGLSIRYVDRKEGDNGTS